jgi:hypothetical protein
MANEEKDLAYYLANPSEVDPTNSALMAQLLAESKDETPSEKVEPAPSDKGSTDTEAKPVAAAPAAPANVDKTDTPEDLTKAPIATRDGKHTIPFEVLDSTRKREAEARERATNAEAELESVRQEIARLKEGGNPEANDGKKVKPSITELDERIASIEQEGSAPFLAETFKLMRDQLVEAQERARVIEERSEQEKQQRSRSEVDEAISNNPTLTYWAELKPDVFARAVKYDNDLRDDPVWANKPIAERFIKVVELTTTLLGKEVLPSSSAPTKPSMPAADPAKTKQLAEAALKNAPPAVGSLSDIPGDAIEGSALETVEKQSIAQLGTNLMNMTPEKLQAWLAANT